MVPEFTRLAQEVLLIGEHFKQQHLSLPGSKASGCKTAKLRSLFPHMSKRAIEEQCATLDQHTAYGERIKVFGSSSDCLPTNLTVSVLHTGCSASAHPKGTAQCAAYLLCPHTVCHLGSQ